MGIFMISKACPYIQQSSPSGLVTEGGYHRPRPAARVLYSEPLEAEALERVSRGPSGVS
jgi:hypothetical protein